MLFDRPLITLSAPRAAKKLLAACTSRVEVGAATSPPRVTGDAARKTTAHGPWSKDRSTETAHHESSFVGFRLKLQTYPHGL
jgi:hypothetical protein